MQKAFGVDGWEELCNVIDYGVTEALAGLVSLAGSFYDVIHEIAPPLAVLSLSLPFALPLP